MKPGDGCAARAAAKRYGPCLTLSRQWMNRQSRFIGELAGGRAEPVRRSQIWVLELALRN